MYNTNGKENDVVISSRVRFARNLENYPFMSRIDDGKAREIIAKCEAALTDGLSDDEKAAYKFIDFSSVKPNEARSYVENHSVSPEFIESGQPHFGRDWRSRSCSARGIHIRIRYERFLAR